MKKFLNILKEVIFWIWQLPQNLVGLFLLLIYRKEEVYYRLNGRTFYFTKEMISGISLGNYIIMSRKDMEDGMKHEYGHSVQSRILGPFYLLLIGIPSGIGNLCDQWFFKNWKYSDKHERYYNQPWEKWADKLGGVNREVIIAKLRMMGR